MSGAARDLDGLGLAQLGEAVALVYRIFRWMVLAVVVAFLCSGVHTVEPGREGHVLRLGAWHGGPEGPGLHWALPFVVDRALTFDVSTIRTLAVDEFAPAERQDPGTPARDCLVTGDGSLIHAAWQLSWVLAEPRKAWAFTRGEAAEEERLVRRLFLAQCLRAASAEDPETLLHRRADFEARVAREFAATLARLDCGVRLVRLDLADSRPPEKVKAAFDDVVRQSSGKERARNEALAFKQNLERAAAAEASAVLGRAASAAAGVRAGLKAEASLVAGILADYGPADRRAFLDFRLQSLLRRALEEPQGQTFVLRPGGELRLQLAPDPVVERARERLKAAGGGR